jgi:glycosyltransferase involved in cell wall biosynthesis
MIKKGNSGFPFFMYSSDAMWHGGILLISTMKLEENPRILRLITRMNTGGPSRQVARLSDLEGYETFTVWGMCSADEAEDEQMIRQVKGNWEQLPYLGRQIHPWKDLLSLIRLIGIIKSFRPHILHTHTAKAGMLGRLAAWLCGVPIIVHTYHGHVLEGYFSPLTSRMFRWIEQQCGRVSNALIVLSRLQYDAITNTHGVGDENKNHIVPLGIDLNALLSISGKPEAEWYLSRNLNPDCRYILWCGRLTKIKHPLILPEICRELESYPNLPDWKILVAGDGDLRQVLTDKILELKCENRIQLLSWETDSKSLFSAADLVILTSIQEGTPVSLIEAMAAGKPIIASGVGGVPDMLESGGGRIVSSINSKVFAEEISQIFLQESIGWEMGQIGRKQSQLYRMERLKEDLNRLYSDLLKVRFNTNAEG